jgi:fermentation-respiration switch protein FrsA (DUF1100 family)
MQKRRKNWLLVAALAAFLGACSVSWVVGGKLVEPTQRMVGRAPKGLFARDVSFSSQSGATIAGWYLDTPEATKTVLLLHPIRGDRRAMLERARFLANAGFAALLIDLQAHGESVGKAITLGSLESRDATAAVAFAQDLAPANKLVAIGWSLGGASLLLAPELALDAVVLEAVYPTIDEALHNRVAMRLGPLADLVAPVLALQLPLRLGIAAQDLRPIDHIAQLGCPVLLLGGGADEHTPPAETRALFEAALEPKQLVLFEGAAHTDLYQADRELYERTVLTFLQQ